MAMRAGTKRARPHGEPTIVATARILADADDMVVDDDDCCLVTKSPVESVVAEEEAAEDGPLRKRAMVVRANLRFLEKLPTLQDDHRDRLGRRGGVDGGDAADSALWMCALEQSMVETSFVTREPPTRAALVAPAPTPVPVPVPVAVAGRRHSGSVAPVGVAPCAGGYLPVTPMTSGRGFVPVGRNSEQFRRRAEVAWTPMSMALPAAAMAGGKDDEARPATDELRM